MTGRRQHLLDTDRWRPLDDFVERWYARPLCDDDGHSPAEIEQVAKKLGQPLPAALFEWFELVGKRLRSIQDSPRKLHELAIEDEVVSVWDENQGGWRIDAPLNAGDDPRCEVNDASFASSAAPLSQTLVGMVASDTLVGAWAGNRVGPLGELGPAVRGGYVDEFSSEQVERLHASYSSLSYPRNPFFEESYRGDGATVIRFQAAAIEWMTATDAAFAAFDAVFGLTPLGGNHEVVIAFDALTDAQRRSLGWTQVAPLPGIERINKMFRGVGRVERAVDTKQQLRFHITTKQPRCVFEFVLAELPTDLLDHLTIATRPAAISVFEVLYPEGKTNFVLP